jgi:outer membrane protein assembly factor BamB
MDARDVRHAELVGGEQQVVKAAMRAALHLVVALVAVAPSVAWGWTFTFGREQSAPAQARVAVDAAGNVVTATQSKDRLTVLRHETATGRRTWSVALQDDARPSGVAVDAAGDVLVAGLYPTDPFPSSADRIVVAKLDDARGTVLWRVDFPGADPSEVVAGNAGAAVLAWEDGASSAVAKLDPANGGTLWSLGFLELQDPAVALDPAGDVILAGALGSGSAVRVMKLDDALGATLWDVTVATSPDPSDVAVTSDASGNAIVVDGGTVLKLAAGSGAELWRNDTIAAGQLRRPVAAANGDVVLLAGATDVVRLDGATGAVRWTRSAAELGLASAGPNAIVDTNDDVLVLFSDLTERVLAALDADTGATLWSQPILGGVVVTATDIELGAAGIVGAGWTSTTGSPLASSLVFGIGARLAGTKLALKDVAGNPAKSTFEVQSKDPRLTPPFPAGAPQDPTVGGATVTIQNPVTLETGVIALPAAGWTARVPSGKLGRESYKYKDANCTATVQSGKRLLVKCTGTLGGFTLDEPSQGALRVTIELGSDGHPYCTAFGGQILQDFGTGGTGTGSFMARQAPAPATCPGAF